LSGADLVGLVGSVIVIFVGLSIIRLGLAGQYLGRFRLVSNVKKFSDTPQPHNRYITIGIGIIGVLVGTALFATWVVIFSKLK